MYSRVVGFRTDLGKNGCSGSGGGDSLGSSGGFSIGCGGGSLMGAGSFSHGLQFIFVFFHRLIFRYFFKIVIFRNDLQKVRYDVRRRLSQLRRVLFQKKNKQLMSDTMGCLDCVVSETRTKIIDFKTIQYPR